MRIIQYYDGLCAHTDDIYRQCLNQVINNKPSDVNYEFYSDFPYDDSEVRVSDYRAKSDIFRIRKAIEYPDMIWLDSDCLIKRWFDFPKKGKPYIVPNMWAFYVNGCTDFFKKIFDEYKLNKCYNYPGWLQQLIYKKLNECYLIPDDYFVHCSFSGFIKTRGLWESYGNSDFEIKNLKNGNYKLTLSWI